MLNDLKGKTQVEQHDDLTIDFEKLRAMLRKIPNWKAPGTDKAQGFWLKNMKKLHQRMALQLQECLDGRGIPEWMTKGRTVLLIKDKAKGNAVGDYRPITSLPIMWKVLTGIKAEDLYQHLHQGSLLPDEQKGSRKESSGTKGQLVIERAILRDCKQRKTNLAIAWIDYKKAHDTVPHSWILETLDLVGAADNIKQLMRESMESWKTQLTAYGKDLGEASIRRGIFQGDSLSPLLFVIAMLPLNSVLNKSASGYQLSKEEGKTTHFTVYGRPDWTHLVWILESRSVQ